VWIARTGPVYKLGGRDELEALARGGAARSALTEVHEDALGRLCVWTLAGAQHGVASLERPCNIIGVWSPRGRLCHLSE